MKETRSRYWATILYPESAVVGWLDWLQSSGIQAVVSPLHDRDLYDYTDETKGIVKGNKKKPHYHIVFIFDSLKSSEQIKEITTKIGSVGQLKVLSIAGTIRYLSHKDCKDKAQYNEKDCISIGGVEIEKFSKTDNEKEEDVNKQFFSISNLCVKFGLFEFSDLVDFLLSQEYYEQFKLVRQNSYFWAQYLKSKRYSLSKQNFSEKDLTK